MHTKLYIIAQLYLHYILISTEYLGKTGKLRSDIQKNKEI